MARMLPDGVSMDKPAYIAFTGLDGLEVILETASITEVMRAPAIPARPDLNMMTAHPERTIVAVRGGSRYTTDLPVSAFAAALNPSRVEAVSA